MKSLISQNEMARYTCPECGFKLFVPIRKLSVSVLGLYDDLRFPGRCILVYRRHVEHFENLGGEDLVDYISDIKLSVNAIKKATGLDRVNICILGNREPHLHAHLIPRNPSKEPMPDQAPWKHPEESGKMWFGTRNVIVDVIGHCVQLELEKGRGDVLL